MAPLSRPEPLPLLRDRLDITVVPPGSPDLWLEQHGPDRLPLEHSIESEASSLTATLLGGSRGGSFLPWSPSVSSAGGVSSMGDCFYIASGLTSRVASPYQEIREVPFWCSSPTRAASPRSGGRSSAPNGFVFGSDKIAGSPAGRSSASGLPAVKSSRRQRQVQQRRRAAWCGNAEGASQAVDDNQNDLATTQSCRSQLGDRALLRGLSEEGPELVEARELEVLQRKGRLIDLAVSQKRWRLRQATSLQKKRANLKQAQFEEQVEEFELPDVSQQTSAVNKLSNGISSRSARLARLAMLTKVSAVQVKDRAEQEKNRRDTVEGTVDEHAEARVRMHDAGERLVKEINDRDAREAMNAFGRYDEDGSGTLELPELRAVFEDLGLLPQTPAEKAAIRRTLVNMAQGIQDSGMGPEANFRSTIEELVYRREQETYARKVEVEKDELSELISRVRSRLKGCRHRQFVEAFRRHDIFDSGELQLSMVLSILSERKLLSAEDPQQQVLFYQWLICIAMPSPNRPTGFNRLGSILEQTSWQDPDHAEDIQPPEHLEGETAVALKKKALKDLETRFFDQTEFEVLVDFLFTHKDHRALQDQRATAGKLGVTNTVLFLEFRQELQRLQDCFGHFDSTHAGRLDENEAWVALNSLGLVPGCWDQKLNFLKMIVKECLKNAAIEGLENDAETRPPWRLCIGSLLIGGSGGTEEGDLRLGTMDFEEFLMALSKIRSWLQTSMREELQVLFERCLRRRSSSASAEHAVLGIPEVCMALEDLKMAPTCAKEQQQVSRFLEDTNEWGFEPLTLDFEAFVRFIRHVREWRASIQRKKEREFAVDQMGFSERSVNEHRIAFDVLDRDATGELDITSVRKILMKLKIKISSEQLRSYFTKVDSRQAGFIRFLEYLRLVFEFEISRPNLTPIDQMDGDQLHTFDKRMRLSKRMSLSLERAMDTTHLLKTDEPEVAHEEAAANPC